LLATRLPHLLDRIHWLDAMPEKFSGAVVANEVLDALPVHLVYFVDAVLKLTTSYDALPDGAIGMMERGVVCGEQGFVWQDRDIQDAALLQAAQNICTLSPTSPPVGESGKDSQGESLYNGYLSEICLSARGLINSLSHSLEQGALLLIDYGFGAREYYHPQRSSGTLMCHYRHHAHDDPFYLPGLQDITAHVNFTDIAETAIDAGLDLLGYTSQAFFLLNCGITDQLKETPTDNLREYLPLSAQLQKLTSPAEMGELFKVMALSKGLDSPLCGFARGDLSRLL
jgi:SAM-dependent MidA family methyltransferase